MARRIVVSAFLCFVPLLAQAPPKAGPVAILKSADIKPGMSATAWTVFQGTEPEAVPIEIIGLWKNAWGPKQDIILGKMGGRAARTNVAGGMSGSPVYIDGKLIGAVALRMSVFSPDAICGITPIEHMLEINDYDKTVPAGARLAKLELPREFAPRPAEASASPWMVPIETPLTLSGFTHDTLREFGPFFDQMGVKAVLGGGGGNTYDPKPAADWKDSLRPGQAIAGVLVSGDMSITGLGTVTYNDGKRVLGFGHPFFNLGPVDMPMSRGEILMVLASAFTPNKFGNATEIVGALKQDRHSGIMGVLGEQAPSIPVRMKVRSYADGSGSVHKEKDFRFHVFVQQKWTPFLMMLTLFNSVNGLNDFAEDATYRFSGSIQLAGGRKLDLATMQAPTDMPVPAPMVLASWWGEKFNRLFGNATELPKLDAVDVTVDLLPERRLATVESLWASATEVSPGDEITVRAFLRPYRGARIDREFKIRIPENMPKGEHRLMASDADSLNRIQAAAGQMNRFLTVNQTVSLLAQERANNRVYLSTVQSRPTVYYEDRVMPNLPASVATVMQAGRASGRPLVSSAETATEQASAALDYAIGGSASWKITVR